MKPTFAALLRSPRTRRGPAAPAFPAIAFSLSLAELIEAFPIFVATAFCVLITAELEEDTLASMLVGLPPAPPKFEDAAPVERTVSSTLIDLASGALLALLARGCCDDERCFAGLLGLLLLLLLLLVCSVIDDVDEVEAELEEEEGRERVEAM